MVERGWDRDLDPPPLTTYTPTLNRYPLPLMSDLSLTDWGDWIRLDQNAYHFSLGWIHAQSLCDQWLTSLIHPTLIVICVKCYVAGWGNGEMGISP